jgi:hypothetical protein
MEILPQNILLLGIKISLWVIIVAEEEGDLFRPFFFKGVEGNLLCIKCHPDVGRQSYSLSKSRLINPTERLQYDKYFSLGHKHLELRKSRVSILPHLCELRQNFSSYNSM